MRNVNDLSMALLEELAKPWRRAAACSGLLNDPDFDFFPEGFPSKRTRRAQALCLEECPVREDCLEYAPSTDQRGGVWGGMIGTERWDELVARGITPPTTRAQYGRPSRGPRS